MSAPRALDTKELRVAIEADAGLLVCCAGYEDRAVRVAATVRRPRHATLRVVKLLGGDAANDCSFQTAAKLFGGLKREETIDYDLSNIVASGDNVTEQIRQVYVPEDRDVYVDVSGFPGHGVCQILYAVRHAFPAHTIKCLYTEAKEYYPKEKEYLKCISENGHFKSERLPESLTFEAKENLILPVFSGFSVRQDRICLFLLAGFEKHRSITAIDGINPTRLVVIYGTPPNPKMQWREALSRGLHADLFANIERAEESVETYDFDALLKLFETYYFMLYNEMSLVVCPINAKLHTVASYLFWERFRDVQLCFPVPVKYIPERSSAGCGHTYVITLPPIPQVAAFRAA